MATASLAQGGSIQTSGLSGTLRLASADDDGGVVEMDASTEPLPRFDPTGGSVRGQLRFRTCPADPPRPTPTAPGPAPTAPPKPAPVPTGPGY
jgi:hypothetical protein